MNDLTISKPTLVWNQYGEPESAEFDDVYFVNESGLDESRQIFIQKNRLEDRWRQQEGGEFTVFETGFGSGLNFLATWQLWDSCKKDGETSPSNKKRLHFISVEKYPLTKEEIERALHNWTELKPFKNELLQQYPNMIPGCHRLHFDDVTLTLFFSSADHAVSQLDGVVDAWFLDGFTPSKNPDMWSPVLFRQMGLHSHPNTTFATFTAASHVNKGLQGAGFSVDKISGFGKKREMLKGTFTGSIGPMPAKNHRPWFWRPSCNVDVETAKKLDTRKKTATIEKIAVIGGGIAGCSTARALAERGAQVELYEKDQIATGASGNLQGVLYAKLAVDLNIHTRFYLSGFQYTLNELKRLDDSAVPPVWQQTGVIQLALTEKEQQRQQKFLKKTSLPETFVKGIGQAEASNIAGTELPSEGLFFPQGGWVNPPSLCQSLINHKNIHVYEHTQVDITKANGSWQLARGSDKTPVHFDAIVLCNANSVNQTLPETLPIKPVRGQVTHHVTTEAIPLNTVVCGKGYVSPSHKFGAQEQLSFGATFDLRSDEQQLLTESHEKNLTMLAEQTPEIATLVRSKEQALENCDGRVGFRCTTPDYTPIVGPVAQFEQLVRIYNRLTSNADWPYTDTCPYHDNLYVNIGHGSRGLISAPLSGEIVASYIYGSPMPLENELIEALHPSRFQIRELIRRNKNE